MSDLEDFGGPINRPASNARQGTAGDLGNTSPSFGKGAQDFLGLDGGPGAASTGEDPFAQPAVQQPAPPSESWLLESADEAPVTIPRSIAAAQPVEPPGLLNTSWSEPERKNSKGRWVGALLGAASLGALALIGYPRLVKRAEPVQEQGTRVAQPSAKQESPTRTVDTAALAAVADDLDTPGAIEPADEYSAPLSSSTEPERVLVGREPEETHTTTALEENGLVEVVDPTAALESEDAEALAEARKERSARRRAQKAQAAAAKLEHELALAAMNADCEPETRSETTGATGIEVASPLGESSPNENEAQNESLLSAATSETPVAQRAVDKVATKDEPKVPEKAWPGVSWLDEIEQLAKGQVDDSSGESESETSAPEAPPASDIDTTWLEFEGAGVPTPTNDAEAEARADAKRERRAAARAARWRAREQALEAARIEHEAALAAMNADCAQDPNAPRPLTKASNEVFWTPALGELPLPGSWAEDAPKAPVFEGSNVTADVSTGEPSPGETEVTPALPSEPVTTDSSSTEPQGNESAPVELASTEATPLESTRIETTPVETQPIDPTPVATAPIETLPVITTPIETAPTETAPVATTPVETQPIETAPVVTAPIETAPVSTPPIAKAPIETTPVETQPIETAPVVTAPIETAPVATAPVETKPVEAAPIESAPVSTGSNEAKPVEAAPVEPTPVEPSVAPALQPVATAPIVPTTPVIGPPAPNGIPPTTPTGVEGTKPNDEALNSGNARVTKLTEQDVVQPTRAQSIVRAAPNDERKGVWDGETIPLGEISRKTRLLTPKVGKVRATLTSGELFEGTLYAVGEDCVWLDTTYGRMGLAGSRVKSVVRTEIPKDPSKPDAPKAPEPERVHIKTPGGTLSGQLLEDDGKQAIVLTDSGARLTVESSTIERISEAQPAVRVQQRKQP